MPGLNYRHPLDSQLNRTPRSIKYPTFGARTPPTVATEVFEHAVQMVTKEEEKLEFEDSIKLSKGFSQNQFRGNFDEEHEKSILIQICFYVD
jgi:hypothetical protein